ncbi:guanine nucleotide exchange factor [Anaeramoeba flamelloides]|uniref:Guanine nucleotide exchange factor n=1 Tax=Anaeramoeba flamelloides TaxID=1746091 RepID=A0AAV7YL26_9EUKA|nr:guanine nucleotide exchange factor [Anaeramoeba flamelloides]
MSNLSTNESNEKQEQILDNVTKSLYSFFDSMFVVTDEQSRKTEKTKKKDSHQKTKIAEIRKTEGTNNKKTEGSEAENFLSSLLGEGSLNSFINTFQEQNEIQKQLKEEKKELEEIKKRKEEEEIKRRKERRRQRMLSLRKDFTESENENSSVSNNNNTTTTTNTNTDTSTNSNQTSTNSLADFDLQNFLSGNDLFADNSINQLLEQEPKNSLETNTTTNTQTTKTTTELDDLLNKSKTTSMMGGFSNQNNGQTELDDLLNQINSTTDFDSMFSQTTSSTTELDDLLNKSKTTSMMSGFSNQNNDQNELDDLLNQIKTTNDMSDLFTINENNDNDNNDINSNDNQINNTSTTTQKSTELDDLLNQNSTTNDYESFMLGNNLSNDILSLLEGVSIQETEDDNNNNKNNNNGNNNVNNNVNNNNNTTTTTTTTTNNKKESELESQQIPKNTEENQEKKDLQNQIQENKSVKKKVKTEEDHKKDCIGEIMIALKVMEPLLIKEEEYEKKLQSITTLYKNRRKTLMLTQDYLLKSESSANMIRLYMYQLYRNLITIKIGAQYNDGKYAVTLKDLLVKKPDYLNFEKWQIIKINQLKKKLGRGEINGQNGKFNRGNVYVVNNEIVDEQYDKLNKKVKIPLPKIPKKISWKYFSIFEIDAAEVARQITIREFEVYQQIRPTELLKQSWNKKALWGRAPNARYMIERFNQFSFWCCTMILITQKLVQRVYAIEYFITLGEHLQKLNNFNCLMGVVSALRSNPLQRLKHTFDDISLSAEESLKDLDELLNSENSFKNYRQALNLAYMEGKTAIPFLGIHLTDLTFLDDTTEDVKKNGEVNLEKMETMSKSIMNILKYQTRSYKLKKVPQLQDYFKNYPAKEGDSLYELSLQREPRGCEYEELD